MLFVVASHIQCVGYQLEKLLYMVANPPGGLLNREKRMKRESLDVHPLPPHAAHTEKNKSKKTQGTGVSFFLGA